MSLVPPAMSGIGPKTRRAGCRFRPLLRRTFGFRLPLTGEASSYSRPVLGASGTLRRRGPSPQERLEIRCRKERTFLRSCLRELDADPSARLLDSADADGDFVPQPVCVPRTA